VIIISLGRKGRDVGCMMLGYRYTTEDDFIQKLHDDCAERCTEMVAPYWGAFGLFCAAGPLSLSNAA
jgi:hypothetical protein